MAAGERQKSGIDWKDLVKVAKDVWEEGWTRVFEVAMAEDRVKVIVQWIPEIEKLEQMNATELKEIANDLFMELIKATQEQTQTGSDAMPPRKAKLCFLT